jgi:hypothetical protein
MSSRPLSSLPRAVGPLIGLILVPQRRGPPFRPPTSFGLSLPLSHPTVRRAPPQHLRGDHSHLRSLRR